MDNEFDKRLIKLHKQSYDWLFRVSINMTKNVADAEDLVQSLFLYLLEKRNEKLFYKDTMNLLYCHRFLRSRFLNSKNRGKKSVATENFDDNIEEEEYDLDIDNQIMESYESVQIELDRLKNTTLWADAQIFSYYFNSDDSLSMLATKLKVSKSTVFLSVKRIKLYLKEVIENPFTIKE
jgi:DNA-directed RNA polymerase specialized sigma24 family protein